MSSSWQKFVKANSGPGVTLKQLAANYRKKQTGGQGAQGGQRADLKITGSQRCNGDCAKHVEQLNVYIRYLHNVLTEDVLKADKISDTAQIVIFCNLTLLNLVTYYFDNYGQTKKLKEADLKDAIVYGNQHANEPAAHKFRESFFKWMGSDDYADLLNSINLGCAVDSPADMKHDYFIKVACLAYGLQIMFADTDLQEVTSYKDASWFGDFIKQYRRATISISDACMPHVSATRKGLQMLATVASFTGKAALATGKAAVAAAPYLGKAALATGKGVVYVAPKVGKVAWYTGEKAWYTTAATARFIDRIPVVGPVARISLVLTLATLDILATVSAPSSGYGVLGHSSPSATNFLGLMPDYEPEPAAKK